MKPSSVLTKETNKIPGVPKIFTPKYLLDDFEPLSLTEIESKACKELIRRTKQDEKEHGTALQHGAIITKDGNEVYYTSGLSDEIEIPKEIAQVADAENANLTLLHSHPANLPPSEADLKQLIRVGVNTIIVVGKDGLIFKVENTSNYRPDEKEWENDIIEIDKESVKDLFIDEKHMLLDVEDRKFLRQHNLVFNVVREYKWKLEGGVING